MLRLK